MLKLRTRERPAGRGCGTGECLGQIPIRFFENGDRHAGLTVKGEITVRIQESDQACGLPQCHQERTHGEADAAGALPRGPQGDWGDEAPPELAWLTPASISPERLEMWVRQALASATGTGE